MAFAGTFLTQIKKIINGKSTSAEQFANDDTSSDSRPTNDNRNEYTEANYRGVLDSDLTSLTTAQKNIFIMILTVLCVLSLCGNICTLFVNFRRKIRPFFRACLISLAFSDLMNTVFLTASYLSQFTADFVQIWSLGRVMCSLVPFATTCAILASSMILVGIALDRYFAVMKAVIGFWNPSVISCFACMLCIWLASISIACPVFTFYDTIPVYILTEEHVAVNATKWSDIITAVPIEAAGIRATTFPLLATKTNSMISAHKKPNITFKVIFFDSVVTTIESLMAPKIVVDSKSSGEMNKSLESLSYKLWRKRKLVNMCVSDQKNISVYYGIVFTIIFVPCIMAFFWFNAVIARKLWKRRHLATASKQRKVKIPNKTKLSTTRPQSSTEPDKTCTCKSIQMSNSTNSPSSMSNTLSAKVKSSTNSSGVQVNANQSREARHLRMFTIILLMMAVFVFLRLPAWIFLLMRINGSYATPRCWNIYFIFGLMNLASSVLNPVFYTFLTETLKCALKLKTKVCSLLCICFLDNCCCNKINLAAGRCSYLLDCQRPSKLPDHKYTVQTHSLPSDLNSKDSLRVVNNEKDEGVDCSDEVDEENICRFHDYNQRIYTIFPSSLVSSSICSGN